MTSRAAALRSVGSSAFLRSGMALLLPFFLILTNVRLMLTPAFVLAEYATPGFPPDPYGFTREERNHWASLSLEFLLNDAGLEFFDDLRLTDGQPLYKVRELAHMVDVKRLVQNALAGWAVSVVAMGVLLASAWRDGGWPSVRRGLFRGARITLILMAALLGLVVLAFPLLFEFGFHRVFFDSGTYLFYYSDTFIRLFPVRFWRDAFGLLLLLTLAQAALIAVLTRDPRVAPPQPTPIPPTSSPLPRDVRAHEGVPSSRGRGRGGGQGRPPPYLLRLSAMCRR